MAAKKVLEGWNAFNKAVEYSADNIYLYGKPGLGKTYSANKILRDLWCPEVWDVTFNEDAVAQEFEGHYIPHGSEFVWHDGPVITALKRGAIVMNEIPRASFAVRDMLLKITDNHESISVTLPSGDVIKPNGKFRVIATGNQSPDEAGLPDALKDRFAIVIEVTEPHPALVKYLNNQKAGFGSILAASYTDNTHLSVRKVMAMMKLCQKLTIEEAASLTLGPQQSKYFLTALTAFAATAPK